MLPNEFSENQIQIHDYHRPINQRIARHRDHLSGGFHLELEARPV